MFFAKWVGQLWVWGECVNALNVSLEVSIAETNVGGFGESV